MGLEYVYLLLLHYYLTGQLRRHTPASGSGSNAFRRTGFGSELKVSCRLPLKPRPRHSQGPVLNPVLRPVLRSDWCAPPQPEAQWQSADRTRTGLKQDNYTRHRTYRPTDPSRDVRSRRPGTHGGGRRVAAGCLRRRGASTRGGPSSAVLLHDEP